MKKVLIVEDNKDTREVLGNLVRQTEPEVKIFLAEDSDRAYSYAMKNTIDVFIVDLVLEVGRRGGDMSGAKFIQQMRHIRKYHFTPVIIVTALYDTKNFLYSETHCYQFIEKPFDQMKMKKTIRDALEYKTKSGEDMTWFYKIDGMVGAVPVKDIIYASSKRQEMNVVTIHEKIHLSYKTCHDLLEELDTDDFLMCKRGTIVNRKYIKRVDSVNRFVYLKGCEDVLEIGPIMKKQFLEWFYEG